MSIGAVEDRKTSAIKWLRGVDKIVVDTSRMPSIAKAFKDFVPRKPNDAADAASYALHVSGNDIATDCALYALQDIVFCGVDFGKGSGESVKFEVRG